MCVGNGLFGHPNLPNQECVYVIVWQQTPLRLFTYISRPHGL